MANKNNYSSVITRKHLQVVDTQNDIYNTKLYYIWVK